jgi:hypothetical protein
MVTAIELAGLIQKIVGAQRNSFYYSQLGLPNYNTSETKSCILDGRGSCGNHQDVFQKAAKYLGIETRPIGIYYENNTERKSHAIVEFKVGGKWRYIDITNSAFSLRKPRSLSTMLSFKEVFSNKKIPSCVNFSHIPLVLDENLLDHSFDYLTADKYFLIQTGGSGTLNLALSNKPETFANVPNYIGSNQPNEEMKLFLTVPKEFTGIYNFNVDGIACQEAKTVLRSSIGQEYEIKEGDNLIRLTEEQILTVKHTPPNICYAVFKRIERMN